MKRPYKVRFNLGRGKNYMKWRVEGPGGIRYYSPDKVQIVMYDGQLKNQRKTAEKILEGAHKEVCAWVRCSSIAFQKPGVESWDSLPQLKYNPRVLPHWFINEGENVDGLIIRRIISVGRKLVGMLN